MAKEATSHFGYISFKKGQEPGGEHHAKAWLLHGNGPPVKEFVTFGQIAEENYFPNNLTDDEFEECIDLATTIDASPPHYSVERYQLRMDEICCKACDRAIQDRIARKIIRAKDRGAVRQGANGERTSSSC